MNIEESNFPKFSEIKGVDLSQFNKIYNPLFNKHKYTELGVKVPKTILIYGVEGVGKKFFINSFANEHQVQIHKSYLKTAIDVRELFRKASEDSIILIEQNNLLSFNNEDDDLLEVKLQLKESINLNNNLVVCLHKDKNVDLIIDSEIFIKIPTVKDRRDILEYLMKDIKKENIDYDLLAHNTPGFIPKDLVKLISIASEMVIIESSARKVSLTMNDFELALKKWKNIQEVITFDDIGAMGRIKEELKNSILLPSKFPEKFARLGLERPSGILLYGPPGCGKTLIAKAVSCMSHCSFLSIKGPELITKYVGDSEKHLRDLFEKAKNLSPCVLFFDEIDSLCGRRGTNEFGNRIVNQILTLMDGMEDRGQVYIIGATNRISYIDKALLRPGRFDKIVNVPIPDESERYDIFDKTISKLPVEKFDIKELDLSGLTGAGIAGVVKEAATLCLRDNFENNDILISKKYFEIALEKFKEMKQSNFDESN
ncbi:Y1297 [Hepatospora eriocheir]|uniref:Y1297 n=1 Tax=Hepatospora eriocheir TaxID=1081669 RepID=A0A1X0QJX6_9MICR|nr:Y1297 [Hepatospora eriocheir]